MTKQTADDFISNLTSAARKNAVLRKHFRGGMAGEGKAEAALPDGRKVVCTFSQSISLYSMEVLRSTFTIDGKRASKEQIKAALGEGKESTADLNPILRSAFEAQAPQLTRDYYEYVKRLYVEAAKKFENKIPSWVKHDSYYRYEICVLFPQVCDVINTKDQPINPTHILVLNEKKLNSVSTKYGDEVAVQWFRKTNEKLGALQDAELVCDSGGNVIVRGIREGKKIEMNQQRILKRSIHGVLFHQFPARIYVQDKFVTEAVYKKLFKKD